MGKFDQVDSGYVDGYRYPYTQFVESTSPTIFAYARNFVLADRMFSSLAGPSFPNHLYTVAAQSGGVIDDPHAAGATGAVIPTRIRPWLSCKKTEESPPSPHAWIFRR